MIRKVFFIASVMFFVGLFACAQSVGDKESFIITMIQGVNNNSTQMEQILAEQGIHMKGSAYFDETNNVLVFHYDVTSLDVYNNVDLTLTKIGGMQGLATPADDDPYDELREWMAGVIIEYNLGYRWEYQCQYRVKSITATPEEIEEYIYAEIIGDAEDE